MSRSTSLYFANCSALVKRFFRCAPTRSLRLLAQKNAESLCPPSGDAEDKKEHDGLKFKATLEYAAPCLFTFLRLPRHAPAQQRSRVGDTRHRKLLHRNVALQSLLNVSQREYSRALQWRSLSGSGLEHSTWHKTTSPRNAEYLPSYACTWIPTCLREHIPADFLAISAIACPSPLLPTSTGLMMPSSYVP